MPLSRIVIGGRVQPWPNQPPEDGSSPAPAQPPSPFSPYAPSPYAPSPYAGPPAPYAGPTVPPPGRGRGGGLMVGLAFAAVVLLLACCGGWYFFLNPAGRPTPRSEPVVVASSPTPDRAGGSPSRTAAPTATPATRDLATLDSAGTDRTPFLLNQFFHRQSFTSAKGATFTLRAGGFYSACENTGGTRMKSVMRKNGCGNMAVGIYLNATQDIMTGVMVIPLPASANATAVRDAVKGDAALRGELWIWCPNAPDPGSKVCETKAAGTYRYFTYNAFHRYAVIASNVYTDGRSKGTDSVLFDAGAACIDEVIASIPRVY